MSCPYCCWALEPSGDRETKSYTTYNAFILCVSVCLCLAVGSGCFTEMSWQVESGRKAGGQLEWKFKFFISTPTHTDRYKQGFFWCRKCAHGTWLRSIMKVLRPTETDSLLCMRVKIPSTRPISASFAGTSEPIRAINTIRPTCQSRIRQQSTS